jgi:hypothetical protein
VREHQPRALIHTARECGPVAHHLTLVPERVHLSYTEPHSTRGTWTPVPRCLPHQATTEVIRDGITALAGPDAAARRTWTLAPCTCGSTR